MKLRNSEVVKLIRTDWNKVERYIESEREREEGPKGRREPEHEYEFAGQAGKELVRLLREE